MHSRESLLADWQQISPAHKLTDEIQDLLLKFLNKPHLEAERVEQARSRLRPGDIDGTSLPPPRRFQRRQGYAVHTAAPAGPAKSFDDSNTMVAEGLFVAIPTGPGDEINEIDESELTLQAVPKK